MSYECGSGTVARGSVGQTSGVDRRCEMNPFLAPVGAQWLAVSGQIPRRFVVNYRTPASRLARLLPSPFSVDERDGFGFVSVCALVVRGMGIDVAPAFLRFDNVEFLYRIGVRHRIDGADVPTFLTLRSDVSAAALAFLGRHFSHYRPRRAALTYREDDAGVSITCSSNDGLGDGSIKADLATLSDASPGSTFRSAQDASDFLLGMDHSAGDLPGGRVQIQPIEHSPWEARFVGRVEVKLPFLEHLSDAFGLTLEYDSTLHMENIAQTWRATRCL